MDGIEFKELFKVAVETLRENTITPLLEADATYQEDTDVKRRVSLRDWKP